MATVREMPLPAAEDTERSCLGSVLLNNELFGQLSSLTPAHFSNGMYRRIFTAMNALHEDGIAMDYITVADQMKSGGDGIISPSVLAEITSGVPSRTNLDHYVHILNEKKMKRDLLIVAQKAATLAYEPSENPQKILRFIEEEAYRLRSEIVLKDDDIFVPASEFVKIGKKNIEWRVDRVIEKGTNGIIQALPKTGKSLAITYLAACLSTGLPWFDLDVQRCKVALVSREDYAGTTARRLRRILAGAGLDPEKNIYGEWLWINTREQCRSLLLDNHRDLANLIRNIQKRNTEVVILDVFNVLHNARDENDAAEMTAVLNHVKTIHSETGAQIIVVHHKKKGGADAISDAGRGSNAIAGFAEFIIDLQMVDEENEVRETRFLTKASGRPQPFCWVAKDEADGTLTFNRVQKDEHAENGKRRATRTK